MAVAHEAPHSMGFSRQENCNGLLFPTPGDLPNPGIDPVSPASPVLQAFFFFYCWAIGEAPDRFFTAEPLGKPLLMKKNKTKQNKTKQNRIKFKTCFSEVLGWQKSSLESFGNIVWKPGGTLLPIQCFFFFFLEKEMTNHSSLLAWRIPWTEEPGGLQSMGWQRLGHDWATEPPPPPLPVLSWSFSGSGYTQMESQFGQCHHLVTE